MDGIRNSQVFSNSHQLAMQMANRGCEATRNEVYWQRRTAYEKLEAGCEGDHSVGG